MLEMARIPTKTLNAQPWSTATSPKAWPRCVLSPPLTSISEMPWKQPQHQAAQVKEVFGELSWTQVLNFRWSCMSHKGLIQPGISHDSMILYHAPESWCDQSVQGTWVNDIPSLAHALASLRILRAPFPVPPVPCRDCATVSFKF